MKKFWYFRTLLSQRFDQNPKRLKTVSSDKNNLGLSRRSFLKKTGYFTLGSFTIINSLASVLAKKGSIALIVAPDDVIASAIPSTWALGELKTALEAQGSTVRIVCANR